jgi:hypothetical protein
VALRPPPVLLPGCSMLKRGRPGVPCTGVA